MDTSSVTGRGGVGREASAPIQGGPLGSVPCGRGVPSPSLAMALHGSPRVLPLALFLATVATVSWARGPPGTLWSAQGCSALGRCCPGRDPTCDAPGPPRCFCDQACSSVRDCCADYARACPGALPGAGRAGGALGALGSRGLGMPWRTEGCDSWRGF